MRLRHGTNNKLVWDEGIVGVVREEENHSLDQLVDAHCATLPLEVTRLWRVGGTYRRANASASVPSQLLSLGADHIARTGSIK